MKTAKKTEKVVVEFSRLGSKIIKEFDTLPEALESIYQAVEHNEAAPVSLTMPATVIGAPPVKFDTLQLYLMSELSHEQFQAGYACGGNNAS